MNQVPYRFVVRADESLVSETSAPCLIFQLGMITPVMGVKCSIPTDLPESFEGRANLCKFIHAMCIKGVYDVLMLTEDFVEWAKTQAIPHITLHDKSDKRFRTDEHGMLFMDEIS